MRPRLFTRCFACLLLASFTLLPLPRAAFGDGPEEGLSAREILDRMATVYGTCQSYQDSGSVRTRSKLQEGRSESELVFSTAFVRPKRFRFEYETAPQDTRYMVWADGDAANSWWSIKPGIEHWKSLGSALGVAGGVSKLTTLLIPSLLLPDRTEGRRLTDMTGLQRLEDGSLDGIGCFRIQGAFGSQEMTLWIDKFTFLVRRIDKHLVINQAEPPFEAVSTYLYQPVLNGVVPEGRLAFDPPVGRKAATR